MQPINNNTPSLLDFSPVRRLYIFFLLAHRKKISVDSWEDDDTDYVFRSLTPSAKRFVGKSILEYTSEPHSSMLRDLLDGEFAPESIQLKFDGLSENIWALEILPHEIEQMEILTLLGFPPETIYQESKYTGYSSSDKDKEWDIFCYLHFHCNMDSDDGWKPQYNEPLAEYFSKSDILSKRYRPFIDLVSGNKSMIRILAENNFWDLYEVYLRQELYVIEGRAIEKALDAVNLGNVKKSQQYLQLAGIASSHGDRFGSDEPEVIGTFRYFPTMLSRDRYLKKQLSEKTIKKPALLLPEEEPLNPELEILVSKSNNDNTSVEVEN